MRAHKKPSISETEQAIDIKLGAMLVDFRENSDMAGFTRLGHILRHIHTGDDPSTTVVIRNPHTSVLNKRLPSDIPQRNGYKTKTLVFFGVWSSYRLPQGDIQTQQQLL